jgi:hypothetical protein
MGGLALILWMGIDWMDGRVLRGLGRIGVRYFVLTGADVAWITCLLMPYLLAGTPKMRVAHSVSVVNKYPFRMCGKDIAS